MQALLPPPAPNTANFVSLEQVQPSGNKASLKVAKELFFAGVSEGQREIIEAAELVVTVPPNIPFTARVRAAVSVFFNHGAVPLSSLQTEEVQALFKLADFINAEELSQECHTWLTNARRKRPLAAIIAESDTVEQYGTPEQTKDKIARNDAIKLQLRRDGRTDGVPEERQRLVQVISQNLNNKIMFSAIDSGSMAIVKKTFNLGRGKMTQEKIDNLVFYFKQNNVKVIKILPKVDIKADVIIGLLRGLPDLESVTFSGRLFSQQARDTLKTITQAELIFIDSLS